MVVTKFFMIFIFVLSLYLPVQGQKSAQVRIGNEPSLQEQEYRKKRKPVVKKAVEKLLGKTLSEQEVPSIAFGFSGGGYRAMNCALGWLSGVEGIGLLDTITYVSAISGSTWFIAPWIASGKSVASYKEDFIKKAPCLTEISRLYKGEQIAAPFNDLLKKRLDEKLKYGLPLGLIDIYSVALGQSLLCNYKNPQAITVSESHKRVATGAWPLPLYTCAAPEEAPSVWIDISPFEVSMEQFALPIWAFGRTFEKGKSVNMVPEQPLAYYLSIFGSLFSTQPENFLKTASALDNPQIKLQLEAAAKTEAVSWGVLLRGVLPNFTHDLPHSPYKAPLMKLVDAGRFLNLPLPSFAKMSRNPDIIVFCDANIGEGPGFLRGTEQYAREKGIPFPAINYATINNAATSFGDNSNAPIVIYLPLRKNDAYSTTFDPETSAYTKTYNLSYTPAQINELSGLCEFNVKSNKDLFVKAINMAVERKAKKNNVKK